jgi:hypothetical protein
VAIPAGFEPATHGVEIRYQILKSLDNIYPGIVVLQNFAAQDRYDDAVEAFARGGSRRDMMTPLMAIGMTTDEIRWHAEYPGRRMVTVAGE